MGTGPFAVPTSERLRADGHEILLVVTRPLVDPKAKKLPPRPVFEWAQEHRLPIFEPSSINDESSIDELRKLEVDLFFVCDYGQILSKACLAVPRLGGINLHGSVLPRHRGAAPVQWALLRGDQRAGVTVIHMTPGLDAGPALAVRDTEVQRDETAEGLEPRLANIGVEATVEAIGILEDWNGSSQIGEIQDKKLVTKAPRFAKADGALDFRLSADYLSRLVRACQPWPGTFAELAWPDNKKKLRLIVRSARALPQVAGLSLAAGDAIAFDTSDLGEDWQGDWGEVLAIGCGEGVLAVSLVQPAGKRAMPAREFFRGHPVVTGCKFNLPEELKKPLDA